MPQTRWTLISDVKGDDRDVKAAATIELCRIYRRPVFLFLRSRGLSHEDAEDLTQELFARFTAKGSFAAADRARGKLRCYIFTAARRLIAEKLRHDTAEIRGGRAGCVSLDEEGAPDPRAPGTSPERHFDKLWAEALLAEATRRLRAHYSARGKEQICSALEPYLGGDRGLPIYAETGERIGLSAGAVKLTVRRMRLRLRGYVQEEIAGTLGEGGEVDLEMESLKAALRPAA